MRRILPPILLLMLIAAALALSGPGDAATPPSYLCVPIPSIDQLNAQLGTFNSKLRELTREERGTNPGRRNVLLAQARAVKAEASILENETLLLERDETRTGYEIDYLNFYAGQRNARLLQINTRLHVLMKQKPVPVTIIRRLMAESARFQATAKAAEAEARAIESGKNTGCG